MSKLAKINPFTIKEMLARAMSEMDGKSAQWDLERASGVAPSCGHYEGYCDEAEVIIERLKNEGVYLVKQIS